jgi:hypothetical protein
MKRISHRIGLALAVCAALASPLPLATPADAAQPWTCICKGEKKRFLASTRHCETQLKLAKGQWCSQAQFRAVYRPACAAKQCRLAL